MIAGAFLEAKRLFSDSRRSFSDSRHFFSASKRSLPRMRTEFWCFSSRTSTRRANVTRFDSSMALMGSPPDGLTCFCASCDSFALKSFWRGAGEDFWECSGARSCLLLLLVGCFPISEGCWSGKITGKTRGNGDLYSQGLFDWSQANVKHQQAEAVGEAPLEQIHHPRISGCSTSYWRLNM